VVFSQKDTENGKVRYARFIAMKLHALRENFKARELKDVADIVALVRDEPSSFIETELRELCEKYATIEIYERIKEKLQ